MRKLFVYSIILPLCAVVLFSCSNHRNTRGGEADSLAYVIGLNVGHSLMEMDSTLNVDAICTAIRDVYNGIPKMTMEEARDYYLAEKTYFVHERAKAYQEQYLADLSRRDRKYVRTRSGVTYKIIRLGDQRRQNTMSTRDTVQIVYTVTNEQGEILLEKDTLRDSYRGLLKGLQEVVRLAGDGAHFNAWLPSSVAYGVEGDKELGVGANTMLNYDVEILKIEYDK